MINQQMVSYIKEQLALGTPQAVVIDNLKKVGWAENVINESLGVVLSGMANISVAPINGLPESKLSNNSIGDNSVNSPYSSLLAVILVVSLLILTNGIFSDIKNLTATVNKILIYEGLFAIPFLLVAFLLHSHFKTPNKRFEILSYPYFIISAWILLRLLWKVGENIWKANNALGVYVILGMIVLVLTGVIIFIQKYIKK